MPENRCPRHPTRAAAATARTSTTLAMACVVGGLGYLLVALGQAVDPVTPAEPGFALRSGPAAVAAVLLVGGPVGLGLARVAGGGRTARLGLGAAAAGWVAVAAAQVVSTAAHQDATLLFVVASAVLFGGMSVSGLAVLRAGVWRGWCRWAPLLCALYLLPTSSLFGRGDALAELAVAGWAACWIVLGAALFGAARTDDPPGTSVRLTVDSPPTALRITLTKPGRNEDRRAE